MINPIQNAVEAYRNAYAELLAGVERMTTEAKRMYFDACAQAGSRQLTMGHRDAIKDAISTLAEKGIAWNVTANGARVPVDVGIRRVMANYGLNARMKQTREIAEEYGQDLVEVNTTANCRESHAEWQGGRYSLSGKSTKYAKFDEACHVGDPVIGIGGYNCQHVYAIWKEGEPSRFPDPLRNTDKSLDEVRALTATQRRYEREIRAEKRKAQLLEQEGFEDAAKIARAKIRDRQARLRKLIAENPDVLRRQSFREQVYAPKINQANRKQQPTEMMRKGVAGNNKSGGVPKAVVMKITKGIRARGAEVRIAEGEVLQRMIDKGASATTYGDVIYIRKDCTISDVLEETRHVWQNLNEVNFDLPHDLIEIANEIEAKEYLESVKDKYKIPDREAKETRKHLAWLREEYERRAAKYRGL